MFIFFGYHKAMQPMELLVDSNVKDQSLAEKDKLIANEAEKVNVARLACQGPGTELGNPGRVSIPSLARQGVLEVSVVAYRDGKKSQGIETYCY